MIHEGLAIHQSNPMNTLIRFRSFRSICLLEYQRKKLLSENNLNVQRFQVVDNPNDARRVGEQFMKTIARELLIKAQILADDPEKGRFTSGLQGGVKRTKDPVQCAKFVEQMVQHRFIAEPTLSEGVPVEKVMIAEALDVVHSTYLSISLDPNWNGAVLMGGVNIEEKAREPIFQVLIDPVKGLRREQARDMAKKLGFSEKLAEEAADQMLKLYKVFVKYDCLQIAVNPFAETTDRRVMNVDVNIQFDHNAKFRQAKICSMADQCETDPREIEARRVGLSWIGLPGNIGCLVNGTDFAMATMDLLERYGGAVATIFDVAGAVKEDQILRALKLLVNDNQIKAVFVNIFAGIISCATVAKGIEKACEECGLKIPFVIRLQGRDDEEAEGILQRIPFPIVVEKDFERATQKIVALVQHP